MPVVITVLNSYSGKCKIRLFVSVNILAPLFSFLRFAFVSRMGIVC